MSNPSYDWLNKLPKVELHLHLEGTLEPELMFELAKRNSISLPYRDIDEVKKAYQFNNLQDFLDIYYQGAAYLAGMQVGFYPLIEEFAKSWKSENQFNSKMSEADRQKKLSGWKDAVNRTLSN